MTMLMKRLDEQLSSLMRPHHGFALAIAFASAVPLRELSVHCVCVTACACETCAAKQSVRAKSVRFYGGTLR